MNRQQIFIIQQSSSNLNQSSGHELVKISLILSMKSKRIFCFSMRSTEFSGVEVAVEESSHQMAQLDCRDAPSPFSIWGPLGGTLKLNSTLSWFGAAPVMAL